MTTPNMKSLLLQHQFEVVRHLSHRIPFQTTINRLELSHRKLHDDTFIFLFDTLRLHENDSINRMALDYNEMTDKSAESVAAFLRSNHSVKVLVLSGNEIGDEGALTILKSLSYNFTLQSLYLTSNNLTPRGMEKLFETFAECPNVTLTNLSLGPGLGRFDSIVARGRDVFLSVIPLR